MVLGGAGGASLVLLTHHSTSDVGHKVLKQLLPPLPCAPAGLGSFGSSLLAIPALVEAACVPDCWEDEQILGHGHLCPELYSEHPPEQGVPGPGLFISL